MTSFEDSNKTRPTGTWRDDHHGVVRRRRRRLRRFVFSASLVAAIVAFALWLADPFQTPRAHVVAAYSTFDISQKAQNTFTPVDDDAWKAIGATHNASPSKPIRLMLDKLQEQLKDIAKDASAGDCVVLSLSSHGIAIDENAFLLADRFQPALEESMLISVGEILDAVRRIPCRTKIVLIDGGQIRSDARLGAAVNEFPTRLKEAVEQANDSSIWVLSSHSQGEISELSHRLGQTVFSHFAERALSGEADMDDDGQIDVGELQRFITENTAHFVAAESGGRTTQTPQLLRGPANSRKTTCRVLAVPHPIHGEVATASRSFAWSSIFKKARQASSDTLKSTNSQSAPTSATGEPAVETSEDPLVSQSRNLAQLVAQGWLLRDSIQKQPDAIAIQPHRFRWFEQALIGSEQACRTGDLNTIQAARKELRRHIDFWNEPTTTRKLESATDDAYTLDDATKDRDAEVDPKARFASLQSSLRSNSLDAWMTKNWTSELENIYEFRIIPQLLTSGITDTAVIQDIVNLRYRTERAVNKMADVTDADAIRIAAEQLLLNKTSERWATDAMNAVAGADVQLQRAIDLAMSIQNAEETRQIAALNVHRYWKWYSRLNAQESVWSPTSDQLSAFMEQTTALSDLLSLAKSDHSNRREEITDATRRLDQLANRIAAIATDNTGKMLETTSKIEGRAWLIEQLLVTAIPTAEMRTQLLTIAQSEYESKSASAFLVQNTINGHNHRSSDFQRARLQLELLRLSSAPATPLRRSIDSTLQATYVPSKTKKPIAQLSKRIRRLHFQSREQIWGLEKRLSSLEPNRTRAATHALSRSLESLDPRDAPTFSALDLAESMQRLASFDRLQAQAARFQAFGRETDTDGKYLSKVASHFTERQLEIFPAVQKSAVASGVRIDGASTVSLAESVEQDIHVSVQSPADTPVWLVAEYDDSAVSVFSRDDRPVYGPKHVESATANRYRTIKTLPVTKQRNEAGDWDVPLTLRRQTSNKTNARVILTAVTPKDTTRKSVQVQLPGAGTFAAVVTGEGGSWSDENGKAALHPLPNRTSTFHLGLRNCEDETRTVDVGLYAILNSDVALPEGSVPIAESTTFTDDLSGGILAQIPKLKIPGGQFVRLALPKLAAPKTENAANQRAVLDHGIVVVASDHARELVSFHRIDVAPQRPRRYVKPLVRFDAIRRQILIEVAAKESISIPKKGIRVAAELEGSRSTATGRKLFGVLKKPDETLELDIKLPRETPKPYRLHLHVDGYPRAFTYDISRFHQSGPVNDSIDQLRVAIKQPDTLLALNGSHKNLPVELRIDAPLGAFSNGRDRVVVGLDLDRDRDLRGDPQVTLHNDRYVRTTLHSMGANGLFEIATVVEDQRVLLPVTTETNCEAELICSVEVDGHSVHAQSSAPVFLDSVAPIIEDVSLPLGNEIPLGEFVESIIKGDDRNLSGIETIEAAFDLQQLGTFTPDMPVIKATRVEGVGWRLRIPTKGLDVGLQSLIIRAVDRAGNVSKVHREPIVILEKGSAAARKTNVVRGKVAFGKQQAASFLVSLTAIIPKDSPALAKEAPVIPPTKTTKVGEFHFPKVPAGKYKLSTRGLLKNMNLSGTTTIIVKAPPAKPVSVTLPVRLKD